MITLEMAQRAIATILERAKEKGYLIAVAVADRNGDFIAFARMDDAVLRWGRNARKKAYTSAIMGRDTSEFFQELKRRGRTLLDYGDPMFTTLPGGLAIYSGKRLLGGIGVTGQTRGEDEALAREGLATMGFTTELTGAGDREALFGENFPEFR